MRDDLPAGTVTFLFTDIEGSTKLLHELGDEDFGRALAEHRRILRDAFVRHGGVEVDTQGDAFFVAFPTAPGALAAAMDAQAALAQGPIRVRMGLHTGTPQLAEEGYVGADVHRAARIAAAGHGGQLLVSLATASLLGTNNLRDLGDHRLRDLSAPERIYQLGEDDFPPLASLYQTNLPIPTTPFLGRERELMEVAALLARDDVRLLTLTGPGGTGKTRLATQAAGEAGARHQQGVWWVPLASLRDAQLVLETAAHTLGAKDGLAEYVGNKSMLILFDNFEQVVEAADDVAELLAACPHLELLVTSREPLHVTAEHEYPVPPLADEEAVDFFIARARTVKPDFAADEAVAEICRRLDDLPLALELAAARMKAFSSAQILQRLDQRLPLLTGGARDLPERQRTLRAAIEWSFDLLNREEQRLFARLSVFAGGCALESAEQVIDADLDVLQSLVDKSLLRYRDGRYWLLETIREYAAERLRDRDEESIIRERHCEHVLALVERSYAERVASMSMWLPVLEAELDNIRAALDWAALTNPQREAQLAGAVAPYWLWAGHVREAQARLAGALARYESRDRVRARLLTHYGQLLDEDREALSQLGDALDLWRNLGDAKGEALALEAIGSEHLNFGRYESARVALEQSLSLRQMAGEPEVERLRAVSQLCHLLVATGDIERAEPMAHELYALASKYDNRPAKELGLHFLADSALLRGDYLDAEQGYRRALAYARNTQLVYRLTDELIGVAMSAAGRGDHGRAVRLAAAGHLEERALGYSPGDNWWNRVQERFIGGARTQLGPARAEEAERAGRTMPFAAVLDELLEGEGLSLPPS